MSIRKAAALAAARILSRSAQEDASKPLRQLVGIVVQGQAMAVCCMRLAALLECTTAPRSAAAGVGHPTVASLMAPQTALTFQSVIDGNCLSGVVDTVSRCCCCSACGRAYFQSLSPVHMLFAK